MAASEAHFISRKNRPQSLTSTDFGFWRTSNYITCSNLQPNNPSHQLFVSIEPLISNSQGKPFIIVDKHLNFNFLRQNLCFQSLVLFPPPQSGSRHI
ncbi:hypothetical protein TNCT_204641 [Trichonephila clavata]|uniref:Uncharacterized protein n=1 Tax=Trichonephila clavata TaxID=2740835 RepID=A0A8X6GD11_TRICU|nr:hypothetical protein TNCT_204641 [Trichonephila clavata]